MQRCDAHTKRLTLLNFCNNSSIELLPARFDNHLTIHHELSAYRRHLQSIATTRQIERRHFTRRRDGKTISPMNSPLANRPIFSQLHHLCTEHRRQNFPPTTSNSLCWLRILSSIVSSCPTDKRQGNSYFSRSNPKVSAMKSCDSRREGRASAFQRQADEDTTSSPIDQRAQSIIHRVYTFTQGNNIIVVTEKQFKSLLLHL